MHKHTIYIGVIFQELFPAIRYIPEEKSGDAAPIRARAVVFIRIIREKRGFEEDLEIKFDEKRSILKGIHFFFMAYDPSVSFKTWR